jgi:hypothetical protein
VIYSSSHPEEGPMLDAFIIEKIRNERERARQQEGRLPLYIEPPPGPQADPAEPDPAKRRPERGEDDGTRGSASVDFRL